MERLQKFLSRAGVSSRRAAEELITDGRVKVNGKVVDELGSRVDPAKDLVLVDGKLVTASSERKYFLFYKPPGVVTTLSDPEGRPSVGDYAQETGGRVFPVGRLDYDAEGALLLTDDGDLANKLMHPSHQVPRVYLAKVKGVPDQQSLQKLVDGVRLEDGMAHAVQARIFREADRNTWVKIVVTEGRQHLVKRLCAAIGHPVVRLYRPAHAGLPVSGLRPGELRALSNDEIRRVKAAADGDAQPEPPLHLPARRHGHAAPGFEPPAEDDESDDVREGDEQKSVEIKQPPAPRAGGRFAVTTGSRSERFERATEPSEASDDEESNDDVFAEPREERPARERAERKSAGRERSGESRERSFGDRKPAGRSFGDRKPAGRSFGDRKPAGRGGERSERSFGDRKPAGRSFGERSERSFGDRKPAGRGGERSERSFGDRKPAGRKFGERSERSFGDRKPAGRGGERSERSFGDRKPAGRSFGDRSERSFGDRKPAGRGGERAERSFGDRKPAGRSFGDRKPSGDRKFGGEKSGGRFNKPPSGRASGGRFGGGNSRGGSSRAGGRSSPKKPRGSW